MLHQAMQRVCHMGIAEVPRRNPPAKHGTIVFLGIFYEPRVLFCEKEGIPHHPAVTVRKVGSAPSHLQPLFQRLVFTGFTQAEAGGIAVGLRVLTKLLETSVTM